MWSADLYLDAVRFAAAQHHGQEVPGTDLPYVVHVVSVAGEIMGALAREPVDQPDLAVACAVLHDVLEDTDATEAALAARFGAAVAAGVRALTKDKGLLRVDRMPDSLARIRAQPREVQMVKLADRIVNLGPPPGFWPEAKRRAYQLEAREILAALGGASAWLAGRLADRIDAYGAWLAG
jgi:(p)ppGpp synthase/HD superfamily hydrolase